MGWSFQHWARQNKLPSNAIDSIVKAWMKTNPESRHPKKHFVKAFIEGSNRQHKRFKELGINSQEELDAYREKQLKKDKEKEETDDNP